MAINTNVLITVCCVLITTGCAGIGTQPKTTTEDSSARLTIEDSYPDPFTVSIRADSSDEYIVNRTYNATDHGTIDLSSDIPSGEIVVVEITGNDKTLWKERIGPSEAYELKIRKDGAVDETIYES